MKTYLQLCFYVFIVYFLSYFYIPVEKQSCTRIMANRRETISSRRYVCRRVKIPWNAFAFGIPSGASNFSQVIMPIFVWGVVATSYRTLVYNNQINKKGAKHFKQSVLRSRKFLCRAPSHVPFIPFLKFYCVSSSLRHNGILEVLTVTYRDVIVFLGWQSIC